MLQVMVPIASYRLAEAVGDYVEDGAGVGERHVLHEPRDPRSAIERDDRHLFKVQGSEPVHTRSWQFSDTLWYQQRSKPMIHVTPNPAARPRTPARVAVVAVACVLAAAIGTIVIARAADQRGGAAAGPEAVARAYFDALASFNAERFEAMARERFAPATLARRTPAERAQMLERIRGDLGTLTLVAIRTTNDEQFTLTVTGSTGTAGRIEIGLEGAPPYRITSVSVEVGEQEAAPPGPPPPPISGSMTQADLVRALDAYLAARAKADEFAGVVAVAKAGKVVFQKPYGLANREARAPVMASTRFNIASIGKAFTKTAVGQLMAQGKLALTDTIGTLLPDYPNPKARAATIDQLLNHQAGIADFFGPAFTAAPKTDFASNADYYRFVSAQPLTFDPGTGRQYCNGCYVVLGEIVARVSGQRYEDYIAQHIFTPAGMTGAGFFRADRLPPAVAQQYSTQMPGANGTLKNAREAHGVAGSGAGGSYAAAADLLAFDDAIRTGILLDAKMTGWFLDAGAPAAGARARGGIGIAGGAPGTNALLETDEYWAVAVVGNLDPPASAGVGLAIKRALSR
jgi:CubicO group peptidase (beta-lactamase class C family)